jgi:urate oxidase
MIYEMRIYEHAEGRADAVRERFLREVATRFPDHGIELVGVFVDEDTGQLTYLSRFADDAARKAAWASFGADEGWKAAKAASETDGPLVAKQNIAVLKPVMSGLPLS